MERKLKTEIGKEILEWYLKKEKIEKSLQIYAVVTVNPSEWGEELKDNSALHKIPEGIIFFILI